jgi:elongation factor Ts
MQITATMVKELRERTGAGMMDCKNALQEAEGDIETAIEEMRKSGVAKAAKKAGRIAAEGNIIIKENTETGDVVILEVNSETDFVAKDDGFKTFGIEVAACILANHPADIDALMILPINSDSGLTVEESRQQLVAKISENISVRRYAVIKNEAGQLGTYLHGNLRIGVLVDIKGGDDVLAKDIAMHVAGINPPPICIAEDEVPEELLEKEKQIFIAQAEVSGKPPEIIEKMILGKVKKFVQEISLLSQPFVKDNDQLIGQLLKTAGATVNQFIRYEVGEGLEKRNDNFAEEVMAQAKGA